MNEAENPRRRFEGIEGVVADPLRFKLKLNIGEDAYTSLRLKKHLSSAWEVGGTATSGAGLAASPWVAKGFFASGSILSKIGLGAAAATPIGWVVAAALVSGGAYFGVSRAIRKFSGSRVETIPKFINTPLDLLGAELIDLMGALAARLAVIDGQIDPAERAVIVDYFTRDWGFEPEYVTRAMDLIFAEANEGRVTALARTLAQFQASNPDCNATVMQLDLMRILREIAEADGVMDEREELALDAIATVFKEGSEFTLAGARTGAGRLVGAAAQKVGFRRPGKP